MSDGDPTDSEAEITTALSTGNRNIDYRAVLMTYAAGGKSTD